MYKNKKLRFFYKVWDIIRKNPKLKPEMEAISYLSDRNKKSLDIGALHGVFIIPMLRYATEVISCEPINKNFKFIKNLYNNKKNITPLNIALSDFEGESIIRTPISHKNKLLYGLSTIDNLNNDNNTQYQEEIVKVNKLDSLDFKNIGLIKIDVEGHEVNVLNGGIKFFKRELPNVIIESEDRHHKNAPLKVIKFFEELNYKCFFILGRKVVPIEKFNINVHQDLSKIDFNKSLTKQDYAYNFLFISPKYDISLPKYL